MKISSRGLNLVKEFEGCLKSVGGGLFKPYICPAGVLTIGWGHTNAHGRKFDDSARWSQRECDDELASDMRRFEAAVTRLVKVPLNQNQFDALVSFAYNCGEGNLQKSTLLRKLNAGDYAGAAAQFPVWNKGGGKVLNGLVRRRAAEMALFRAPTSSAAPKPKANPETPRDRMPQQVDPPRMDKPSIFERVWTWLVGGGVSSVMAFLTDWRVVVAVVGSLLVIGTVVVLFMGPQNVRQWIRDKVNR